MEGNVKLKVRDRKIIVYLVVYLNFHSFGLRITYRSVFKFKDEYILITHSMSQ